MIPKHLNVTGRNAGDCERVRELFTLIGSKWPKVIILFLAEQPYRFSELRKMIPGLSQRMLTLTLRNLERDGIVLRTVIPTVPPRVDYSLTPLGWTLVEPVGRIAMWAFDHVADVEKARADFDERAAEEAGDGKHLAGH